MVAGPGKQTTLSHVRCKTIETTILRVNKNSFTGQLIVGALEKRAPVFFFYRGIFVPVLVHFFFSLSLIFTLVAASTSHFLTAATKFLPCTQSLLRSS